MIMLWGCSITTDYGPGACIARLNGGGGCLVLPVSSLIFLSRTVNRVTILLAPSNCECGLLDLVHSTANSQLLLKVLSRELVPALI
jgi:hypothetical protein